MKWLVLLFLFGCCVGNNCPSGWQNWGSGCYKKGPNGKDFDDAIRYCNNHGGKLVEISSAIEQASILKKLDKDKFYRIGITDRQVEGEWRYSSSNSKIGYKNWLYGDPSNDRSSNCAQIYPNGSSDGRWFDYNCHDTVVNTICERN